LKALFLLLLVFPWLAWSAPTNSKEYAKYYEALTSQAVSRYYHASSFVIDVRLVSEDSLDSLSDSTIGSTSLPENLGNGSNPDGLTALPGLPVLPEQMQGPTRYPVENVGADSKAPNASERAHLGLGSLLITVLVDTSYSRADLSFIQAMVPMVAKLDLENGDQVNVRTQVFPRLDRSLASPHLIQPDTNILPPVVEPIQAPVAGWNAYWEQIPSLLPLILILVFLTVIVFMVVRGLRETKVSPDILNRMDRMESPAVMQPVVEPPHLPIPNPGAEEQARFENQRTICLNALIGDPAGGALVLGNWIGSDRAKGLSDSSIFVESLDTKVLDIIKPYLPASDIQSLQLQMDVQTMPPLEERTELLKGFYRDLRTLRTRSSDGTISDIFGFLHQLSTHQLLHIFKDEPIGIVSLALAQIPGERAGLILQQMEPEFRSQLLVGMGQIDTIPVQAYKEVANRLARKALEVGNMRFVAADGVQTVLDIVQGLGIAEQAEYLDSIAERDIHLAGRLRRFFAQFAELPTLPETILVKVLNSFDRDQLVTALVDTTAEYREQLLAAMPQRMRMAVESGLEGRSEQSPIETERARKSLLVLVRHELQNAGGRA